MKKYFILLGITVGLFQGTASADALKNSLTNMMNEKEDSSSMVNLGGINLNNPQAPTPKPIKTRPTSTVIATVNGHKIIKKDADAYLKQRTQGKVTDFDFLPPEQRGKLVKELSLPLLVVDVAKKELSEVEKEMVYTRTWMRKEAQSIKITDEQAKEVYNGLSFQARENNSTAPIPPFDQIKDRLKMQMLEKAIVTKVMKDADIKVDGNTSAGSVNGITISVEEANKALEQMTKGKMTWAALPDNDKKKLLEVMAPSKLMTAEAKKSLSAKEKESALAGYWMQKKMSTTEISDKMAQEGYDKMIKAAKAAKSKQKIPSFETVKNNIKMQLAQEKVVSSLMKNAKINVK